MAIELQFLGAAGTVTGSKSLLTINGKRILVDCGLFQGLKSLRLKNWDEFPVEPSEIHAVILTHAHIDHSGYIPRLVKKGFRGKVYSTTATYDVCRLLLPDCGYLLEEEAEYLNRIGRTKHKPAFPLFTQKEAENSLAYFEGVPLDEVHEAAPGVRFRFRYSGHILGAASVVIEAEGRRLTFTGDVGRPVDRILFPPAPLLETDYFITEATYGNRLHENVDPLEALESVVNQTCRRGGVVVVPAFAVGRAQTLMHDLLLLRRQNRIPSVPMYLNSPMATDFTTIFRKHKDLHRLSETDCRDMAGLFKFVKSADDSKALNLKQGPMIIISASGMLTGGRVLHHLKAFAPYPQNTIVLAGFQSAGTRGEALQNGAAEIKIHGDYIPIRAQVRVLDNVSAHADYLELITWMADSGIHPKQVFINHGEPSAADEFRRRLTEKFGWNCIVPAHGEKFRLE